MKVRGFAFQSTLAFLVVLLSFHSNALDLHIQSNHSAKSICFTYFKEQVAEPLKKRTAGRLNIQLYSQEEPKSSIYGSFNSAHHAHIDGFMMTTHYWGRLDPIFNVIGDLPTAWSDPMEFLDWLTEHKGSQYLAQAYAKYDLRLIGYSVGLAESFVSFQALTGLESFKGKTVRVPNESIKKLMHSFGANSKTISFDRMNTALEKKRVDIADATDISNNLHMGLYHLAKHTNYPGFHSMPLYDFVLNEKIASSIHQDDYQIMLELVEQWREGYPRALLQQAEQDIKTIKQLGVTVHTWSEEELNKARALAKAQWLENAKSNQQAINIVADIEHYLQIKQDKKNEVTIQQPSNNPAQDK